ncbi:hypothetical protein ABZ569_33545 [Streptomyces albus]|uniref:hypothetical protein n=1 Tax=Streptomyces albus TaxID=1888 RepID=UPI0033CB1AF1
MKRRILVIKYLGFTDFELVTTDGTVYQGAELVPSTVAGRTIPTTATVVSVGSVEGNDDWVEVRLTESGKDYVISFPEAYVVRICARDA